MCDLGGSFLIFCLSGEAVITGLVTYIFKKSKFRFATKWWSFNKFFRHIIEDNCQLKIIPRPVAEDMLLHTENV